jgi:DNA-binding beta-propeller fold protein YncE
MVSDSSKYIFQPVNNWGKLPEGWTWGWIPSVACDSQDRVYIFSRSEHHLIVFDHEGNFLDSWGEGILKDAHGIYVDAGDNVYCTENNNHCIYKFNRYGELVMTLATSATSAEKEGDPFNQPTDVAIDSKGDMFVSDGYTNRRVHKFSRDGKLLFSWGEHGTGPGQFALPHCVRIDRYDRVWVCDRENNRIQIFDTDGNYLSERTGLKRPAAIYFDPDKDVVYIAELDYQVSIYTLDGELIAQWGGGRSSDKPGEFLGCPHGIWMDSRGALYVSEVGVEGRLQKFVRQERR